jgi:hypothetical protein
MTLPGSRLTGRTGARRLTPAIRERAGTSIPGGSRRGTLARATEGAEGEKGNLTREEAEPGMREANCGRQPQEFVVRYQIVSQEN